MAKQLRAARHPHLRKRPGGVVHEALFDAVRMPQKGHQTGIVVARLTDKAAKRSDAAVVPAGNRHLAAVRIDLLTLEPGGVVGVGQAILGVTDAPSFFDDAPLAIVVERHLAPEVVDASEQPALGGRQVPVEPLLDDSCNCLGHQPAEGVVPPLDDDLAVVPVADHAPRARRTAIVRAPAEACARCNRAPRLS